MGAKAHDSPAADCLVEAAVEGIASDIARLRVPGLAGVVLGGGYGRGEGGVKIAADGAVGLSNDLDFFAVVERGGGDGLADAVGKALAPVGETWSGKTGISVDFTAKTPERLKKDEERLMVQELLRGYCDVWGRPGKELFAHLAMRPAEAVPWSEAARLLVNRGMGLLFAREPGRESDFVARNLAKCVMGAGDAKLVARGAYCWKAVERAAALADPLYDRALAWKFRPREEPPCSWEEARAAWLASEEEVGGADAGKARSLRQAVRWLVRRRSLGPVASLGRDPIARLLSEVARAIRGDNRISPAMRRDWVVFN